MRKPIFDLIKSARGGKGFGDMEVAQLDDCLDRLGVPRGASGARRVGKAGLNLIKSFEGLKLTAYLCPAKVWTIGYGSTGQHVKQGMAITEAQAEELLRDDLARFEASVARTVPNATQSQFDAMVSLAFNIGVAGFEKSTVARKAASGDHIGAARSFALWNKAGGKVLSGLTRRREAEANLYRKA